MSSSSILVAATIATLGILLVLRRRFNRVSLPPGPKGQFFFGNLKDVTKQYQWLAYADLAKKFGDVISLRALGHTFVVLNSARDVREVLVKRGKLCAARMRYVMYEHAGWKNDVHVVSPDGLRIMKRFATRSLSAASLPQFTDASDKEITACLKRLLIHAGPFDPEADLKWMAGGVILRITYGYEVTSYDDEFIKLSDTALHTVFELTSPGWIIDAIPWLRHLPDWVFGPRFVRTVTRSREVVRSVRSRPIEWTQKQLAAGAAPSSLAAELLALPDHKDNEILFALLADLYAAGMDTTLALSLKLLIILALYPEVQAKAQQEVDNLTKGERLPMYSDRPHLPYIGALVKELYRFRGVVNMGFPHRVTQDIEYKGYIIPEDAIVCANIWAIFHDPTKYPDPFTFNPERYLGQGSSVSDADPDEEIVNEDPTRYIFGFEPRKCVGRFIADSTLFLLAAKITATCHVSRAIDEHGETISRSSVQYTGGFITQPYPYKCTIQPRRNADILLPDELGQ